MLKLGSPGKKVCKTLTNQSEVDQNYYYHLFSLFFRYQGYSEEGLPRCDLREHLDIQNCINISDPQGTHIVLEVGTWI